MAGGGKRPGAGRPKGAVNKRTAIQTAAIEASGMTPLEYLTSIYQDIAADEAKRLDAAKAAAPYVHAKLASIAIGGDESNPVRTVTEIRRSIVRPGH